MRATGVVSAGKRLPCARSRHKTEDGELSGPLAGLLVMRRFLASAARRDHHARLRAEDEPVGSSIGIPPPSIDPRFALSSVSLPDGLGATRMVIGEGAVWALASTKEGGSNVLVRIDPSNNEIVATTRLEADAWYLAAGGGSIWVGFPHSSAIQQIDAATNEVTGQWQLQGDGVSAITADDQAVWVEVFQDRSDQGQQNLASLVRIDPRTAEIVATVPLEGLSGTTTRSPSVAGPSG
jgi:hypothetical protein